MLQPERAAYGNSPLADPYPVRVTQPCDREPETLQRFPVDLHHRKVYLAVLSDKPARKSLPVLSVAYRYLYVFGALHNVIIGKYVSAGVYYDPGTHAAQFPFVRFLGKKVLKEFLERVLAERAAEFKGKTALLNPCGRNVHN